MVVLAAFFPSYTTTLNNACRRPALPVLPDIAIIIFFLALSKDSHLRLRS